VRSILHPKKWLVASSCEYSHDETLLPACCPALRNILLYCIEKVIRCIRWGYIATNFICGYIGVYAVPRRVILPLKLVCWHYVLCTWAKSKEIRPTSHHDILAIHGNPPHTHVCQFQTPPQHAVTKHHTTTVTTCSNKPATTYTMAQAICSDCKRVAITLYQPM